MSNNEKSNKSENSKNKINENTSFFTPIYEKKINSFTNSLSSSYIYKYNNRRKPNITRKFESNNYSNRRVFFNILLFRIVIVHFHNHHQKINCII